MEYLSAINPGIWPEANRVAKREEENEDHTGIIRGVIDIVRVSLGQGAVKL